jgi:hypothetical protein
LRSCAATRHPHPRGWVEGVLEQQSSALDAVGATADAREKIFGGNFDRMLSFVTEKTHFDERPRVPLPLMGHPSFRVAAFLVALMIASASGAVAQTDEIQVYDGALTEPGVFNLMVHNNFTPNGQKTPAFPGANVADKSLNGVPEWAYGVTSWFEAGLYMPLYSIDKNLGATVNGFKLRALFAVPHADDRRFFYGANFEFSINSRHWDQKRYTSEVRPIIGWHLKPVDIIVNPIVDTSYDGLRNLIFAPATRVAYNLSKVWAISAEEYDDFGPVHKFNPVGEQSHQIFAVVNRTGGFLDVETGIGFGLTDASDKITLKLMLSRDLNAPRKSQ